MSIYEIIVLVAGTLLLVFVSWNVSLRNKRLHGIPRFFVFESILILLLLNYSNWFRNPFSLFQILSWVLLISSAVIAFLGFRALIKRGKSKGQIENTTRLITKGMYKYIRHPVYLSLIPGTLGILFKDIGSMQVLFTIIVFISLIATVKIEEKELIRKFGTDYKDYIKKTKMFIPFIF